MNICGVELKSNEAIICLLSLRDGLFNIPECRVRRLSLADIDSRQQLQEFQFTFAKLMADYKVDQVVIRQRPGKGKFAGSAAGFKLEAAIQLAEGFDVELLHANDIKEALKRSPLAIPFKDTGLKAFQESAFTTAFAYLNR